MPHAVPPRRRAGGLFFVAAAALAVAGLLFAAGMASYISAERWVNHTLEVRRQVSEWLATVLDGETGARGYVATGNPVFVEPYEAAVIRERDQAASVQNLVADNTRQTQRAEAAARQSQRLLHRLRGLVALTRAGHRDQAVTELAAGETKTMMDAFRDEVHDILAAEQRLLVDRRARVRLRGTLTLVSAALLMLLAASLLVIGWTRERAHDALATALAKEARERLQALSELAGSLTQTNTVADVAHVIVDHGTRLAAADTCTLYLMSEARDALDLIGERGCAPEIVERIRRITRRSGNPATFESVEAQETVWAETEADYVALYPALAKADAEGPRARAFWSIPLTAEGKTIGLLGAGYYATRTFSADERAFLETLADQCAQALLRASRREREEEAQRWFTTTLRSIGDAVIATDVEGRVTFINPVAERLTGWNRADAQGQPLDEVFAILSEVTRRRVESPVAKVMREGKVVGLANHTLLRSRRGVEIPIDDSGAPIRGEDGRLIGIVLVFRDASQEKRTRARSEFLAKAGEALVSSLDYEVTLATVARLSVPMLADWCRIDMLDSETGKLRQVALAHTDPSQLRFAQELGQRYPPDPNASTGVWQVIRTGQPELLADIPDALLESIARDRDHLRILREAGLRSAMVIPLRARGRILGAMTFAYAESERHYTDEDLAFAVDFARRAGMAVENAMVLKEADEARARERALRSEAEMANRAKDEFLATVSHELRTPLNAILGWTVTMRRRSPGEDVDRALAIIERNARAQARLVDDVLDLSRIISGKMVLNMGPTSVTEAVATAVETVSPAAHAKAIRIIAEFPDEPVTVLADADRLQQVVWNLLSNGVKFTAKGGEVSVRVQREGSHVCIRVRDTGEGIPRDLLPLVFEPFRQGDASTTRRHGGLGLGLAIVKRLVDAHGGSVHAESEGTGKGATFTVNLPARAAVPAVTKVSRPLGGGFVRPNEEAPRLDGMRLLVVDDEEDARALLSEVLRDRGAEVHVASSAHEALAQFTTIRPDVLVSDIGMPDDDGYFLIRMIRSMPQEDGGRTPAVALTAYARHDDRQRAFAAGFQVHVPKPVEPLQLVTTVANLAGRSQSADGPRARS